MEQDEIIDIANDMAFMACIWIKDDSNEFKDMVAFAKKVAAKATAKERKRCIQVCKTVADRSSINTFPTALECADAIRARAKSDKGTEA